jgi:hypothetical protein
MAAPETVTTLDLSGRFVLASLIVSHFMLPVFEITFLQQNKTLSDSTDRILELQGVGWLTRKAINLSSLTLDIKHYKDDNGVEHIDIEPTLTGGIAASKEPRTLDWTFRERDDKIFGAVLAKSRRTKVEDIDEPYLQQNWSPDTIEHHAIEAFAESDTSKTGREWTVRQV